MKRECGIASIALILMGASVATAAPGWSPPVPLSAPVPLLNLQLEMSVAFDPLENALAVWNANGVIQGSYQIRGGPWSAPMNVSRPADYEDTFEPQAVLAPLGSAPPVLGMSMAIWTSGTLIPQQPRVYAVKVAVRQRGSLWTEPVALATSSTFWHFDPRLALDVHGNALAVWQSTTSAGRKVIQAATRPYGGGWSVPVDISPSDTDAYAPQLAMNPLGHAVVVWHVVGQPGNPNVIQAASKRPGGPWSAPVKVSSPAPQTWNPSVAIDAVGRAVAVWNQEHVITAAVRSARGLWSPPTALSMAGMPVYGAPAVAMNLDGQAVAAWSAFNSGVVQAATRPPAGPWSAPMQLSTYDESASDPRVAIGTGKTFMAVTWVDNWTNTARATTALGASSWGAPVTLGSGIWNSSVEVVATLGARARAFWGAPGPPPAETWVPVVSSYRP